MKSIEKSSRKPRKALLSVFVAIAMVFSLSFAPALASAKSATGDLAAGEMPAGSDIPEWAIDNGENTQEIGLSAQAALPSTFDLRDEGKVTPVKLQNPWGSCWAFGGTAAAETSILSAYGSTYKKSKLDLSERHLAYFALSPVSKLVDPAQKGEGVHTFDTSKNAAFDTGGSGIFVTTLFSQGVGPVPESAFPYWGKDKITALDYTKAHPREAAKQQLEAEVPSMGLTYEQYIAMRSQETGQTEDQILDGIAERLIALLKINNNYAKQDDWTIPEKNADGKSNRLMSGGMVLKSGNVLTDYYGDANRTTLGYECHKAMKQELVNGRGVSILYGADQTGTYVNSSEAGGINFAQYVSDQNFRPGHSVCIVGWDDDYAASNFTHTKDARGNQLKDPQGNVLTDEQAEAMTTPPAKGAWIVKNSWGSTADACKDALGNVVNRTEYGAKNSKGEYTGYFYLSYYDKSIAQIETMEFSANLGTSGRFLTLQHDYMPACNGFYSTPATSKVQSSANVFDAGEAISLKSVSTRTSEANMRVTFAIYLLKDNATGPTDGKMLYRTSCNFEYGGFHRFDLERPISIAAGKKFSVVSTTSTLTSAGKRSYSVSANRGISKKVAEEARKQGISIKYYSKAKVNEGESYLYSGGEWQDWKTHLASDSAVKTNGGNPVDNFSIKVYAESSLTHFKAVAPTYTKSGNTEYWYDASTGKYYSDAAGKKKTTRAKTLIAALGGAEKGAVVTAGSGTTKAKYEVTSNKAGKRTAMYVAVASKGAKKAVVPKVVRINGKTYKVTKIADRAFDGSKATCIVVGSYVTAVGKDTFAGASKVKRIYLGKNVKKVAAGAFTTNNALRILLLKTSKLAKKANVKDCLKGSKVTSVRMDFGTTATNAKYAKMYQKLFSSKNPASGKKVSVK